MAGPTLAWPPTLEQMEARKKAFVDDIDPAAVCRLASRHNAGRPCRLFQDMNSGCFNACFFVEFSGDNNRRWNVRVAIGPTLHDAWTKVQSEVATMQYIARKTTIPVARVHGYGRGENLSRGGRDGGGHDRDGNSNGAGAGTSSGAVNGESNHKDDATQCAYMILDYIAGQSINVKTFAEDTRERKTHLYAQLIDILAQLRQLEFAVSGSLMPDPDGGPEPVVGDLVCIEHNELLKQTRGSEINTTSAAATATATAVPQPTTFRSTVDYAFYQYRLMAAAHDLPVNEAGLNTVRMEVFALYDIKARLLDAIDVRRNHRPFVLAHTDLRWYNIVVNDDLDVQGVIDWEWTGTIPQQFFMPPTWLAEAFPSYVAGRFYRAEYQEFYQVLVSMADAADDAAACVAAGAGSTGGAAVATTITAAAATTNMYRQLADEWGPDLPEGLDLPMAVLLRHHHQMLETYYFSIFPKFFTPLPLDYLASYFAHEGEDGPLSRQVAQKMQQQDRYTRYLKDKGLFVSHELPEKLLAHLKRGDAVCANTLKSLQKNLRRQPASKVPAEDPLLAHLLETQLRSHIAARNRDDYVASPENNNGESK
ncbi:Aminoglycoside phosphotransferase [Niveomyces insectorum RCEF 264]|uniref:Aminoglycoside phosphotransferase n=1 Tax=Niveomyces insectorum RCEF 264 TaxID=1081102 RepID=A0A162MTE4_9HYPO|nr:Aminoglycoside phosphotransferase [Niveomyces insectorum RCEF 264]